MKCFQISSSEAYNLKHGITPQSVKTRITDALGSVYEQDYVTVDLGVSGGKQLVGKSLRDHIVDLDKLNNTPCFADPIKTS